MTLVLMANCDCCHLLDRGETWEDALMDWQGIDHETGEVASEGDYIDHEEGDGILDVCPDCQKTHIYNPQTHEFEPATIPVVA